MQLCSSYSCMKPSQPLMRQITLNNVYNVQKQSKKPRSNLRRKPSRPSSHKDHIPHPLIPDNEITSRHILAAGGDLGYYFPSELFSIMAANLPLADLFSLAMTDKLVSRRTLPLILEHIASVLRERIVILTRIHMEIFRIWAWIDSDAFGKFIRRLETIFLNLNCMGSTTQQIKADVRTFIQVVACRPEFVCHEMILYQDDPSHHNEYIELIESLSIYPSITSLTVSILSCPDPWDWSGKLGISARYARLPLKYIEHFEVRAPSSTLWTPGSFREFLNTFQCADIRSFTVAGCLGKEWLQGFFDRHPQISDIFIDPGDLFHFPADYPRYTEGVTIPPLYPFLSRSLPGNTRQCQSNCGNLSVLRGTVLNLLPYLQHVGNCHTNANKIKTLVVHDVPGVETIDFVQGIVQCVDLCSNLSALKVGYRILRQFSVQDFYDPRRELTVTLCYKEPQNADQIASYAGCWANLFKKSKVRSTHGRHSQLGSSE